MLIGTVRPRETVTAVVEASQLEEAHAFLSAQAPVGFVLTNAPVRMGAGTDTLTANGTYSRRDGAREIEAADMDALRAQVPDEWILLHVRSVQSGPNASPGVYVTCMTMEEEVRSVVADIENARGAGNLGVYADAAHVQRYLEGLTDLSLEMARRIDRLEADRRER